MRKVIVQELVSVDGYAADTEGGLDFFESVTDYSEVDADNLSILGTVDTIVLGAATYGMFVEYWPTAKGEPVADAVNTIRKLVFSSSIDKAPWGEWPAATVVTEDAVDHIGRLRGESGGDIMVWGSISLARSLLRAGLVDELQLRVIPLVIGAGQSLTAGAGTRPLALREAKPYRSGIVSLVYTPR